MPRNGWPDGIQEDLHEEVRRWCRSWGDESIADRTPVTISTRMRRTLGCAMRERPCVRVNAALLAPACHALLREVLCHEFAHVFIHASMGRRAKPHGREWRALMVREGFPPRATIPWQHLPGEVRDRATRSRRPRRRIRRFARSLLALFA